jgi:alanyl-tRNA synthetase
MTDILTCFQLHMKQQGAQWLEDEGVISRDPKQLFWVAGAAPLIYDGIAPRSEDMASVQTCLRMDKFESIGKEVAHHISFPMLGHFSWLRHDAQSARRWALGSAISFVRDTVLVPESCLVVSVHPDDHLTAATWVELGFPTYRQCVDAAKHTADFVSASQGYRTKIGIRKVNETIRFWDIVFFDQLGDSDRTLVDSGMSLDRLLMAEQGVSSSYLTKRWSGLCATIKAKDGDIQLGQTDLRRLADIGRAAAILLVSGVKPGPKKHEYVLRKLLREMVGLIGGYTNNQYFLNLIEVCLQDVVNHYARSLQVADKATSLARALAEWERFSDSVQKALRKRDQLLQHTSSLTPEEVMLLRNTHGLPVRLLP